MQKWIPSPFVLALLLSFCTALAAYIYGSPRGEEPFFALELLSYWEKGFFSFLSFSMQMMLILVLGYVLALSSPMRKLIAFLLRFCRSTERAVLVVCGSTMCLALCNWGLALVFGAILVREIGEDFRAKGKRLNYSLLGAAGYSGMMIWHAGLSGSAPLAVAEPGHSLEGSLGLLPMGKTVLSNFNIILSISVIFASLLLFYLLARLKPFDEEELPRLREEERETSALGIGAERLEQSPWLAWALALLMLFWALYKAWIAPVFVRSGSFDWSFSFLNPNYLIFLLFALALAAHGSIARFLRASSQAISSSTGILIQFPLYGGIMGLMTESGLLEAVSNGLLAMATRETLAHIILFSSALVNIFVPSGGGQWMVQGPLVASTSQALGLEPELAVLALSYGDQLTNMLQPFWALPLLGITGLRASAILPYSVLLLLLGYSIYSIGLFLWFL